MSFKNFRELFANRDRNGRQFHTAKKYSDIQKHLGTCEEVVGILKLKSNPLLEALNGTLLSQKCV